MERSSNIELRQLAILNPLGPGIQFFRSTDGRVMRNFVQRSAADGIHVAGPSSNMTLDGNVIFDSGDDGLSSIGYATGTHAGANHNITISNNRVRFRDVKWGSGIAVEGTTVAKVLNNYIERSGSAGIRIGSISGHSDLEGSRQTFLTGGVTSVEVAGNELVDVETRANFNQGAIHIAAMAADVSDMQVSGNTISSASSIGTTTDAIRLLGKVTQQRIYYVKDVQIWNNAIHNTNPGIMGSWCISRSADTTMNITLANGLQRQYLPNTYQNTEDGGSKTSDKKGCAPQLH